MVVVGGGPAGLAAAFWRRRIDPAARVVLLEGAERLGGHVRSERREGFLCEWGPQAVRPAAGWNELVAALDLDGSVVPADRDAGLRWIGTRGRLRPAPAGPLGFLASRVLRWSAKWRALRETRVPSGGRGDESVTEFVARRFGPELVPLAGAMVRGIFAGDADELELRSAFPALAEIEREHGSILRGLKARRRSGPGSPALVTLSDGMRTLSARLAGACDDVRTSTEVQAVRQRGEAWFVDTDGGTFEADEVHLAIPARRAAAVLAEHDPVLATALREIPFVPVANVHLGVRSADLPRTARGFGFLLTPGEAGAVLGCIYVSDLFPDHAPEGHALFRVMIGGAAGEAAVGADDSTLVDAATAALRQYARVTAPVVFSHVSRVRDAIPQYAVGHRARLVRIASRLATQHPGLRLRGNSYLGVALGDQLGADAPSLPTALVDAVDPVTSAQPSGVVHGSA